MKSPTRLARRPNREQSAVLAAFSMVMAVLSWPTVQGRSSSVVPSFQTATYPWAADPRGLAFAWPQSDQAESVFPWSALLQRTWRSRELPLWDPHSFGGGVPWATDGVAAPLYPPRALLDGLLPLWLAHDVFVLLHLALAGAGAYWLARRWGAGRLGATVAGTGWMTNAYVWSWAPLEMVTPFFAYLPLALAASDAAVRRPSRRRIVVAAGIVGLTLVFGNITYALVAATTTGLYLATVSVVTGMRADRGRRVAAFGRAALATAAVFALGVSLASFALLPTLLNLLSVSRQPFTFDTLKADLMVPFDVYGEVVLLPSSPPSTEEIIHMVYLTPAVILLALVGMLIARGRGAWSARTMILLVVLVASTVPGAWIAYHLLPGFDAVRPYARLLPVALLAVHVLSGLGADALLRWTTGRRSSRPWIAPLAAVVVVGAVVVPGWATATRVDPPYLSVGQHPPYPSTPLIKAIRRAGKTTPWIDRIVPATSVYDTEPPTGDRPTFVGGTALAPGFDTWGGYASAVPARSSQLMRLVSGEREDIVFAAPPPDLAYPRYLTSTTDWALACRMGSDLVTLSPRPPEGTVEDWGSLDPAILDDRYAGADGRLVALPTGCAAGPYLSSDAVVADSDIAAIEMLRDQGADALRSRRAGTASRAVVLSQPATPRTESDATGRVTRVIRDGSDVVARVETTDDMWLVLPVAYDEGWSVAVDDEPVTTSRVDFNRLAVRVEAGSSDVVATYRPPGWGVGLMGTALGVLGCGLLLVTRPRRRTIARGHSRHEEPSASAQAGLPVAQG